MESEIEEIVVNNQKRYLVRIPSFYRQDGHILYQAEILDCAFIHHYTLIFRFKTLKALHTLISKKVGSTDLP